MRKRFLTGALIILALFIFTGCTEQATTRGFGGSMEIYLEPGQKLELITWKDSELWYCTRPMRDDEFPETHTYQESSEFGVFEGTVIIIEQDYKNE